MKKAIQQTLGRYQCPDVIHNNTGIAEPSKILHEAKEEEGDRLMNPDLKSLYYSAGFITGCILPVSGGVELGYRQCMNGTEANVLHDANSLVKKYFTENK